MHLKAQPPVFVPPEQEREAASGILDELKAQKPFCDQPWARAALTIASRAIRRGRLLTDAEKLSNLADALESDGADAQTVAFLRSHLKEPAAASPKPAEVRRDANGDVIPWAKEHDYFMAFDPDNPDVPLD